MAISNAVLGAASLISMIGGTENLKVDTAALEATAGKVTALTNELSNQFSDLQDTVSATAHYWIGAAGDQYRKEFAARKAETEEILTLLRDYPKDLLELAGIYVRVETGNTEIPAQLPPDFI